MSSQGACFHNLVGNHLAATLPFESWEYIVHFPTLDGTHAGREGLSTSRKQVEPLMRSYERRIFSFLKPMQATTINILLCSIVVAEPIVPLRLEPDSNHNLSIYLEEFGIKTTCAR